MKVLLVKKDFAVNAVNTVDFCCCCYEKRLAIRNRDGNFIAGMKLQNFRSTLCLCFVENI